MHTPTLDRHVLVLNKSWRALGTTTVREAIVLLMRGSAVGLCVSKYKTYNWEQWIDPSSDQLPEVSHYIQSVNQKIPAPEAIVLRKYDDVYQYSVKFTKKEIYRRDDWTCQYCSSKKNEGDLSIDHVIPRSKKGKNSWANCVTCCLPCNAQKSNKMLKDSGMSLIREPEKPIWNPFIRIKPESRLASWGSFVKKEWWEG